MKLISLKIQGFKNLDLDLDFTQSEGISVFVGNNGSGKSNVLEAISAIFYGLYDETNERRCAFSYELKYIKDGKEIFIVQEYSKGGLGINTGDEILHMLGNDTEIRRVGYYINGEQVRDIKEYLPLQVIALYSGEETRLYENYYMNEYNAFVDRIIDNNFNFPKLSFISKDHWQIALIVLLRSDYDISNIIGIKNIEKIKIECNESNIRKFLASKSSSLINNLANIVSQKDELTFDEFKGIFQDDRELLYTQLVGTTLHKVEKNRLFDKIIVIFDDGTSGNDISEGQKKQILIFFVTQILAEKDSIILLDEPDSYIHVGNKQRLKQFFDDFLSITQEGEIIMTTHSPTLMHKFDKKHLFYLENGKLEAKERAEILKQITGDTMSYTEQQIILNTSKDILIVEGKTDETYIKTALEKLKEDNSQYRNLDFEFLLMGGSDHEILKRFSEQFPAKQGQKIMAFFDRDDSGTNCIKNALGEENIQKDTFAGKKLKDIYINFYPKKTLFSQSNFEVEDYFRIEKVIDFLYKGNGIKVFGDTKSKLDKNAFANECKNFDKFEFEGFKVLFDLIKSL